MNGDDFACMRFLGNGAESEVLEVGQLKPIRYLIRSVGLIKG
jgi:hypothetical protein